MDYGRHLARQAKLHNIYIAYRIGWVHKVAKFVSSAVFPYYNISIYFICTDILFAFRVALYSIMHPAYTALVVGQYVMARAEQNRSRRKQLLQPRPDYKYL